MFRLASIFASVNIGFLAGVRLPGDLVVANEKAKTCLDVGKGLRGREIGAELAGVRSHEKGKTRRKAPPDDCGL